MGKNLKGKELGLGISQRKDGLYSARFTSKQNGKVVQKYFSKLQDARNWYAEAVEKDNTNNQFFDADMTVNEWYEYWIEYKLKTIRNSSCITYESLYLNHIKGVIGNLKLANVKPLNCQNVINKASDDGMSECSLKKLKIVMINLFAVACDNDIILKNPCNSKVKTNNGKKTEAKQALTIEQQKAFIKSSQKSVYYNDVCLVLQTGLRVSELRGLKWKDIDFENKTLKVCRNLDYNHKTYQWEYGYTKTKTSEREIPLTNEAIRILKLQKNKINNLKVLNLNFADNVFLNPSGLPNDTSAYHIGIKRICKRANIDDISIHILRHTFATRCIEAGMKPKTLQMILGHSNISTTMNLYVHITSDEKKNEMEKVMKSLLIV